MRWTRYATGLGLAAVLAYPAAAQQQPAAEAPAAERPAPRAAPMAEGVAAIVNDEIISTYDLRQRMMLLIATTGVKPTQENLPALQQQALRSLVDERLQMQELERYEVPIEDEEINAEIEEMAKDNNMTGAQLVAGLKSMGVAPETLRQQIRAQTGWRQLVGGRYGQRARVDDSQVDATLQRIAAAAAKPQYLVGEIYIDAATVGGMDEATNGANQLVQQLMQGAPFQAVARQFSSAASAANGGDAGWLISGEIVPEVQTVLEQMQPGQLSRPIQTETGVYIMYLREKRSGGGQTVVDLKQAAVRVPAGATEADLAAAQRTLSGLREGLTCSNIEERAGRVDGVIAGPLGESPVAELAPAFQEVANAMQVGQVSEPVRTDVGLHLIAMCGKRQDVAGLPSKDQIENRLYGQQLSMLARRYLRDLRNSATIETR